VVLQTIEDQREVRTSAVSESNIRVDVGLLDKLMNLVGELVLARNQILQYSTSQQDATFLNTSQRLNLITTELQEGVMKTRMQPIGNIWSKFPRVVRDLALACGKKVRIEMEGRETDLDKTIIEAIKDPLTHLVRNVVDHGIEAPEVRSTRGKPPEGRLLLRAFHEGGQVNIEISDDGAGINLERVKENAVARGLISREQAARMSAREALNLIFLPGLSTAEKITNVSGRGVGMDVVKTNIEKIGGTVDIQTRPGEGTIFKIKIPLTLAIIPALIVTSAGDRYAIPQVSLLELVRLEGEQARKGIEMIQDAPVYRLRGTLLPLVYLNRELGATGNGSRQEAEGGEKAVNMVVLRADDRQFGLVVDEINDTEEIVVKPLGKQLKGLSTFAGATIMGDGHVALILDVLGLAQRAAVVAETRDRTLGDHAIDAQQKAEEREALLLFRTPGDGRMAIPLALVSRLEEFSGAVLERIGGQQVVQYRDEILPLIPIAQVVPERRQQPRGVPETFAGANGSKVQVVVYSAQGKFVGLVVDRILDIVEERLTVKSRSGRQGTLGSAVIQGKVTELLDVDSVMRAAGPLSRGGSIPAEARA
jgi:two-component system chemotaxis sensor kinase CheA